MFGGLTGVIEGFYGPPWSWEQRLDVMAWCHERGMTHYVYAPKDDPLHRERWREPYADDALDGFARNAFFLIVDGRQATGLDDVIPLRPTSNVTFVRLVPLRGG